MKCLSSRRNFSFIWWSKPNQSSWEIWSTQKFDQDENKLQSISITEPNRRGCTKQTCDNDVDILLNWSFGNSSTWQKLMNESVSWHCKKKCEWNGRKNLVIRLNIICPWLFSLNVAPSTYLHHQSNVGSLIPHLILHKICFSQHLRHVQNKIQTLAFSIK